MVQQWARERLEQVARVYEHAIAALWIGNAGASLATLSFIGATWNKGVTHSLIWPLGFFLGGLVSMGVGSVAAIIVESGRIHRYLKADSILDLQIDDIDDPAERAGLTFSNWRTRCACLSGALFVLGCLTGFAILAIS